MRKNLIFAFLFFCGNWKAKKKEKVREKYVEKEVEIKFFWYENM